MNIYGKLKVKDKFCKLRNCKHASIYSKLHCRTVKMQVSILKTILKLNLSAQVSFKNILKFQLYKNMSKVQIFVIFQIISSHKPL